MKDVEERLGFRRIMRVPEITWESALLGWLYAAELCVAFLAISLHKKGERSLATFLSAPAGIGLLVGSLLLAMCALKIISHVRRQRLTSRFQLGAVVILNALTVSALLALGEVSVRLFTVATPAGPAFGNTVLLPKDWDRVAARYRETLRAAAAHGSYLVFDRDLGWVVGRSRRSQDPYRQYRSPEAQRALGRADDIYLSSAEGLRSPVVGMSFADVHAKHRIALVGDSFTFGLEVHYDDTWGKQLELALGPETQVLNFGVDGYGVDQATLRYRRDVVPWHPEIVILSVINDDLRRTMCVYAFLCFPTFGEIPFPKPRFVLDGDSLRPLSKTLLDPTAVFAARSIEDLPFIDHDVAFAPAEWQWHFYDHSRLVQYVLSRFPRWPEPRAETSAAAMIGINGALFQQFLRAVREAGSIPVVAFLPASSDFSADAEGTPGIARSVLKANGIPFYDLKDCVRRVPAADRFVVQHYAPAANRAVAECMTALLREARLTK